MEEIQEYSFDNVDMDKEFKNIHVTNKLEILIMCIGERNLFIAALNDGFLRVRARISKFT